MTFKKEEMDECEADLKPCPICGSKAVFCGIYTPKGNISRCYIACSSKYPCIRTSGTWDDPFRALMVWNRRVKG